MSRTNWNFQMRTCWWKKKVKMLQKWKSKGNRNWKSKEKDRFWKGLVEMLTSSFYFTLRKLLASLRIELVTRHKCITLTKVGHCFRAREKPPNAIRRMGSKAVASCRAYDAVCKQKNTFYRGEKSKSVKFPKARPMESVNSL